MKLNSNIKGFPLYHVTKDGKVYNIRRNREVTIHPHYRTGRNIVHLYSNGKRYNLKVYRLVDLVKTWGISQRNMNRYIHKIKTGYYEA